MISEHGSRHPFFEDRAAALEKPAALAVQERPRQSHNETGCQMTGDKFRARAGVYIKAARAAIDPVHKLALMDVAQGWLRLAAQKDGAAIHASRNSEAPATAGPVRAGTARISGDGAPIARKIANLKSDCPESWVARTAAGGTPRPAAHHFPASPPPRRGHHHGTVTASKPLVVRWLPALAPEAESHNGLNSVRLRLIQSQSFPRAHRSCIRPHRVGTPVPPHRRILRPDSFGSIECQTPYAWEAKRKARFSRASAGETSGLVDEAPRSRRSRYTPHRSTTPHIWLRWSRVRARPVRGQAPASHQD